MKALLTRIRDGLSETPRGVIAAVIYYMVLIVSCAVQSAIMDRDLFAYDLSMLRAIVCMSVSVRAVWLLVTRAHSARWFCVFGTSAFLLLSAIDLAFVGAFAEIAAVTGTFVAVLLLLLEFGSGIGVITYLIGSSKIHAFLFEPDASDRGNDEPSPVSSLPLRQRIKTWPFWRDTGIYFIVFSMLGHWAEILFCRLIILGVFMGDYDPTNIMLWDQWLFPFSAEGIALVMVVLLLHPLKERFLRRFGGRKLPTLLASFALNLAAVQLHGAGLPAELARLQHRRDRHRVVGIPGDGPLPQPHPEARRRRPLLRPLRDVPVPRDALFRRGVGPYPARFHRARACDEAMETRIAAREWVG